MQPRISLEQWRCLVAVVEAGGYARAAEALHKSQSAVTYAIQKLETALEVQAFEIRGRKAVLTPTGQLLYRRAKALLDEAGTLERAAKALSAGWEAEITLVVEILFPTWLLLNCLDRFGQDAPHTRIELIESVLGGTPEALVPDAEADCTAATVEDRISCRFRWAASMTKAGFRPKSCFSRADDTIGISHPRRCRATKKCRRRPDLAGVVTVAKLRTAVGRLNDLVVRVRVPPPMSANART